MSTKQAFLAAFEAALRDAGHKWLDEPADNYPGTKGQRFVHMVQTTINGRANLVGIDSPSFVAAWRAIGQKGRPSYKGLRALPHEGQSS